MSDFCQIIQTRLSHYNMLNEIRLHKAYSVMAKEARIFLKMLPALLHYNLKELPGFINDDAICGVYKYTPDETTCNYILKKFNLKIEPQENNIEPKILGIYTMGSTASIGQSYSSDLDIWVCISHNEPKAQINALVKKCKAICDYAKTCGVEVNLFVTLDNKFKEAKNGILDSENCGSALNLLLLDEFYRSAVKIAGKYLIWYLVPTEDEISHYDQSVQNIYKAPCINKDDFFDFGSVIIKQAREFFGSGLWQLYKAIESPFKSVIKLFLMEAYANDYPKSHLISSLQKDQMLSSGTYTIALDAYYLMYKKVKDYLVSIKDTKRLNLVNLCFYIKISQDLDKIEDEQEYLYKQNLISALSSSFNLTKHELEFALNKKNWKIQYVQKLNSEIFNALIQSYKSLLRFSIKHGIENAITSDDASVLSRKLYAAFDQYPGKIHLYNKNMILYMSEQELCFIHPSDSSLCAKQWYLYTKSPYSLDILNTPCVYSAQSVASVVAWACFNNLLGPTTRIYTAGNSGIVEDVKILKLYFDLIENIVKPPLANNLNDSYGIRKIHSGCVILNFEDDPTDSSIFNPNNPNEDSSLSFGPFKDCLIGSITLIFINTWGELKSVEFSKGEDGVIELLATLLRIGLISVNLDKSVADTIKICSYSKYHSQKIIQDLRKVMDNVLAIQLEHNYEGYNFQICNNSYRIAYSDDFGSILKKRLAFGVEDFDLSIQSKYGMRPEFALQIPSIVDQYSSMGIIQYFFAPKDNGIWDIYIINERNEVKIYKNFKGSRANLVNNINRFYTLNHESRDKKLTFNLPQYFVLNKDLNDIHQFKIKQ